MNITASVTSALVLLSSVLQAQHRIELTQNRTDQTCVSGFTGNVPGTDEYVLVWADEFNSDGPVCSENWHHQTKLPAGDSWYNGELQHYTNRTDNSYIEDGYLKIVAKRESFTDQGVPKNFTSARLNSKIAFTYGRVDVRAKLPSGDGTWPAIWTLGRNINETGGYWQDEYGTVNWPACGEIDIMEHWGNNPNVIHGSLHTPSSSGATINTKTTVISNVSDNFYVYSIIWTEDYIQFLVDDVAYYTYNPTSKNASTWPFDEPQYLLLNIAMGGIGGTIDAGFNESTMEIDYVRVYQNTVEESTDLDPQTIRFSTIGDKIIGDDSFTLEATSDSGLEVEFSTTSDRISLNNKTVQLLSIGEVQISAQQPGNGQYAAATPITQTFCINPLKPEISLSSDESGGIVLNSSSSTGNQWYIDGDEIVGANGASIKADELGIYTLKVSINGCESSISDELSLVVTSLDLESEDIIVSPNPVMDIIKISGLESSIIQVMDMSGQVYPIQFKREEDHYSANISELAAGLYLINIQDSNSTYQMSILKR